MSQRQRLNSIDILRAVAASSVLLYHLVNAEQVHGSGVTVLGGIAQIGYWGVDMFFVISGFIMAQTTQEQFGRPGAAADFMVRRGIRIIPLYWACTIALAALVAARPSLIDASLQQASLLASLFFLPQATPPLLAVGWTLNFEMFFYAVTAVCLLLASYRSAPCILALWAVAAVLHTLHPSGRGVLAFALSPMIIEFVLGFCAHRALPLLTGRTGVRLLLVGLACVVAAHAYALQRVDHGQTAEIRVLLFALPATLIVLGVSALERAKMLRINPAWKRLGDASYALYLTHLFVITLGARAASSLGLSGTPARNAALVGACVVLCWVVADSVHRRLEAPVTRGLLKVWSSVRLNGTVRMTDKPS